MGNTITLFYAIPTLGIALNVLGFVVADVIFLYQIFKSRLRTIPSTVSEAMIPTSAYARVYYGFELVGAFCCFLSFYPFVLDNGACCCRHGIEWGTLCACWHGNTEVKPLETPLLAELEPRQNFLRRSLTLLTSSRSKPAKTISRPSSVGRSCMFPRVSNRWLRWLSHLGYLLLILIPTTEGADSDSLTQRAAHQTFAFLAFFVFLFAEWHTLVYCKGGPYPYYRARHKDGSFGIHTEIELSML